MTASSKIAGQASFFIKILEQTDYQIREEIDAELGVFKCDCNGFVGVVLQDAALANYDLIPKEAARARPRAFEYYDYFTSLATEATSGWRRVDRLLATRPGDVIAWRLATRKAGEDTGHVMIVADTPTAVGADVYSVRVYDSAADPHFADTRVRLTGFSLR